MIEKLEELTVAQFTELMAGNPDVLLHKHEIPNPQKLEDTVKRLIFEYKSIADEPGMNAYLSKSESVKKARLTKIVFSMLSNLIEVKQFDRVREVLEEMNIRTANMDDRRLSAEIASRLARAKSTIERAKADAAKEPENIDIRKMFDEQTASLMAHFKFQIDPGTMKATLYAHLVNRMSRDIKAQMAAMKMK